MSIAALALAAAIAAPTAEEIGVGYAYCAAGLSTVVYRLDTVEDERLKQVRERVSLHARAYANLSIDTLGETAAVAAVRSLVSAFMELDAQQLADWLRDDGEACRRSLPDILRSRG